MFEHTHIIARCLSIEAGRGIGHGKRGRALRSLCGQCPRASGPVDSCGVRFVYSPKDSHGFLCIPVYSYGSLCIPMDSRGFLIFLWTPLDFYRIPVDYSYVSLWISMYSYRYPMDYYRILMDSYGFLCMSMVSYEFL